MIEQGVRAPDHSFSLLDDPLFRLQRALRLAPRKGLGAPLRALGLALFTWVPIMVWAALTGHLASPESDPFLRHLGVHVRCLLAIPLMVLSEPVANWVIGRIVGNFVPSGLIRSKDRDRFEAAIRSIERWRDSKVVWITIIGIVAVRGIFAGRILQSEDADALTWAQGTTLDFGGAWALYVVRPLFLLLLLVWLWRLILTWILFRRIAKFDLELVPSHPDRVGGLGFLEFHSVAFTMVILAISSVVCAGVAHQILSHEASLKQYELPLLVFVALLITLFILPLTSFQAKLRHVALRARFEYGTLAGRHVRGLHERWIEGRAIEDDILSAPEIGPAADVQTLYVMGTQMKLAPIGKVQLLAILLPAAVPLVLLLGLEVPIMDVLLKLLNTLI